MSRGGRTEPQADGEFFWVIKNSAAAETMTFPAMDRDEDVGENLVTACVNVVRLEQPQVHYHMKRRALPDTILIRRLCLGVRHQCP